MFKNYKGTSWDYYVATVKAVNGDGVAEDYSVEGMTRGTSDKQKARELYNEFTYSKHMTVDNITICGECYYNKGVKAGGTGRKICRI